MRIRTGIGKVTRKEWVSPTRGRNTDRPRPGPRPIPRPRLTSFVTQFRDEGLVRPESGRLGRPSVAQTAPPCSSLPPDRPLWPGSTIPLWDGRHLRALLFVTRFRDEGLVRAGLDRLGRSSLVENVATTLELIEARKVKQAQIDAWLGYDTNTADADDSDASDATDEAMMEVDLDGLEGAHGSAAAAQASADGGAQLGHGRASSGARYQSPPVPRPFDPGPAEPATDCAGPAVELTPVSNVAGKRALPLDDRGRASGVRRRVDQ